MGITEILLRTIIIDIDFNDNNILLAFLLLLDSALHLDGAGVDDDVGNDDGGGSGGGISPRRRHLLVELFGSEDGGGVAPGAPDQHQFLLVDDRLDLRLLRPAEGGVERGDHRLRVRRRRATEGGRVDEVVVVDAVVVVVVVVVDVAAAIVVVVIVVLVVVVVVAVGGGGGAEGAVGVGLEEIEFRARHSPGRSGSREESGGGRRR